MNPQADFNWIKISPPMKTGQTLVPENRITQLSIDGKELYLTYYQGSYYAGDHRCPHAGGLFTQGWLNEAGDIVCPHHRYCFDLETGSNSSGEGYYVHTYPIEVRRNGIYIGLPKKKWWQLF